MAGGRLGAYLAFVDTSVAAVTAGIVLGAIGAGAHLGLSWWRARLVTSGRPALAWLTFPLGLALVGVALYAASRIAPSAAWSFVIGLFVIRAWVLRRVERSARLEAAGEPP